MEDVNLSQAPSPTRRFRRIIQERMSKREARSMTTDPNRSVLEKDIEKRFFTISRSIADTSTTDTEQKYSLLAISPPQSFDSPLHKMPLKINKQKSLLIDATPKTPSKFGVHTCCIFNLGNTHDELGIYELLMKFLPQDLYNEIQSVIADGIEIPQFEASENIHLPPEYPNDYPLIITSLVNELITTLPVCEISYEEMLDILCSVLEGRGQINLENSPLEMYKQIKELSMESEVFAAFSFADTIISKELNRILFPD